MKQINLILLTVAAVMSVQFLPAATNDWENLAVNSINRLPPRTYAMPLKSMQDALTDDLEPATPYAKSLNGIWKYSWAGCPSNRVMNFWRADFDDSSWFEIDVPSCVEMRGFGSPGYTNIRYPHAAAWPQIRNRDTGKDDYNPVSSYRTRFTVPADWADRDVILRFDGVYSAYYVWVNGQKVGYAEDSKLPSEFDITKYLLPSNNLLAVEVYRWCDGSFLEDQDMTRFSGIFRDVTLWAKPKDGIWDFAVKTTLAPNGVTASVALQGVEGDWLAVLYDADKKEVGRLSGGAKPAMIIPNPRLWSAEDPYLYTLVVKKGDDIRMKRIGFKEQKIVGNALLVNGKKIKLKGVNRHETNPENGRTVTLADMLRDVTLMKRYNVNTVRTSHYPDHHLWYDLCDRYGIYLVAEANVEGHEPGYGKKGLGLFPEWEHSIVERNLRHVAFYRNHPSVTLWSMGNETGHGDCFRHAIAEVKKLDPSRPIHWERGNPDADVDSTMYPTVEWLEERGKLGASNVTDKAMLDKYRQEENYQTPGKAFFLCEYAHAMGNAMGNFQEYWDVFYRYDALIGGCIWDWIDQAVWKETDRVNPKTGVRERYLAYGGDFDEQPNDGPFNCNGVIGPLREVTPKLVEVGHVYRNLVVTRKDDGSYELWNRFGFTRADEFEGRWELVEDGVVVDRGVFVVPPVKPLSRGALKLPAFAVRPGVETLLNVSFVTKSKTLWAACGWCIARDQLALGNGRPFDRGTMAKQGDVEVTFEERTATVSCNGLTAIFSRQSGALSVLVVNGRTLLADPAPGVAAGPHLTCARAFTDNDGWFRSSFYRSGLAQLRYHARPIEKTADGVKIVTEVTGSKSAGFTHEAVWHFAADGTSATIDNRVTPHGTMPERLPRLGLSLIVPGRYENLRYYGRGPWENYVDRSTASFLGIWNSTVTDQFVDYVRPQDNGAKSDVRWLELTDVCGRGLRFSASVPLFMQALHYGWEDLEFARHRPGAERHRAVLRPRPDTCLNLDLRQNGLGGASCGPGALKRYEFPVKEECWTLRLEAIGE